VAKEVARRERLAAEHERKRKAAAAAAAANDDESVSDDDSGGGGSTTDARALRRASDVGEEYADVRVTAEALRARDVGAGIVDAARRSQAEAIVMGSEPPSRIKGGATMGGIGAAKPAEIGAATEYVLKKAPCRVLLTAPPEGPPEQAEQPVRV